MNTPPFIVYYKYCFHIVLLATEDYHTQKFGNFRLRPEWLQKSLKFNSSKDLTQKKKQQLSFNFSGGNNLLIICWRRSRGGNREVKYLPIMKVEKGKTCSNSGSHKLFPLKQTSQRLVLRARGHEKLRTQENLQQAYYTK
jgi:hypothetical protein